MSSPKRVRVTKLRAVDDPRHPTPQSEEYTPGEDNGDVSLPVEYTTEGEMMFGLPFPGKSFVLKRDTRNGVKVPGSMITSTVQSFSVSPEGTFFTTRNSVYRLEEIDDD